MNGPGASKAKSGPGRSSGVGERLRTYLVGVGIGVVLLGMFAWLKMQSAAANGTGGQNPTPAPNNAPANP